MAKILIIDDDYGVCKLLSGLIRKHAGYDPLCSATLGEGLEILEHEAIELVFLDVLLPDGNGLAHIGHILKSAGRPEIIVMTGAGDPQDAAQAIHDGVWDYLQKPFTAKAVIRLLREAIEFHNKKSAGGDAASLQREGIIGSSAALRQALEQLAQAAHTDGSVLITGETGTGKELFAQALHANSGRCGNFVILDCAALPENLAASVLFGHCKGAFTGADTAAEGLVRQADGGTLFLDEVGEMPLSLQKIFLRVLESRRFRPIGAKMEIVSDFRIVASTNRDLDEMVRKGQFRKDLLFRLRSFHLQLPPLRHRAEDIIELAQYHLKRLCALYHLPYKSLSADFCETLTAYDWPGNVRELVNALNGAVGAGRRDLVLYSVHLPREMRARVVAGRLPHQPAATAKVFDVTISGAIPSLQSVRDSALCQVESGYLNRLLSSTESVTKACTLSGLSRSRFYELLKKYDLQPQQLRCLN